MGLTATRRRAGMTGRAVDIVPSRYLIVQEIEVLDDPISTVSTFSSLAGYSTEV